MKKFAKTLALVLALCMVMSVSAFASGAELADDYVIDITVDTATGDEQVALLVVKAGQGINDDSIVYVGQMAATGGEAVFESVAIANTVEAVDIYAGNATYAAGGTYETVIQNLPLTEETADILVSIGNEVTIVDGKTMENGEETMRLWGTGVSAEFDFTLPTENVVEKMYMIWSLRYAGEGGATAYKYTPSIDVSEHLAGLDGTIRLSVAFGNGSHLVGDEEAFVDITGAAALFKFVRADGAVEEIIPDEDEPNDLRLEQN